MHGTGTRATLPGSAGIDPTMEPRMSRARFAWLAALIAPVIVIGGLTGALVAHAERSSQVRVA